MNIKTTLKNILYYITLPLRRWWGWLMILLLLFVVPTLNGVKPAEVGSWYLAKLASTEKAVGEIAQSYSLPKNTAPKANDNMVELQMRSSKNIKRKGFERAEKLRPVNVLAEEEFVRLQPVAEVTIQEIEQKKSSIDISKLKKSPSLRYFKQPKSVKGIAVIHDANELEIDGQYIFLYGVYIDPDSVTGQRAKDFLNNITERDEVDCQIVALTYQNVATAICFVDDININQLLVKEGLTRDVLLNKR